MVKIIAVLGSPTKNGNTCILAREVLRGAVDSGASVEEIFLADYNIEYCRGCINKTEKHCMSEGQCIIKDDSNSIRNKLYEADGIIFASPAYGIKETARMKNFLVDRIGMFTVYTSSLAEKYYVGVSTCGGIGANTVAKNLAKHFVGGFHKRGYLTGYIGVKVGLDKVESKNKEMQKAYRLGVKLAKDISNKKKYILQNLADRVITKLLVRKIILKNIYQNKDTTMKAVYANLVGRSLIKPCGSK